MQIAANISLPLGDLHILRQASWGPPPGLDPGGACSRGGAIPLYRNVTMRAASLALTEIDFGLQLGLICVVSDPGATLQVQVCGSRCVSRDCLFISLGRLNDVVCPCRVRG